MGTNKFNSVGFLQFIIPGIVSNSKPGGGTTDYIVEMLYNAKQKKSYTCFLKENTCLPMIHVQDAVDASIKLMNLNKNQISLNYPYNISSFETSPNSWLNTIRSLGYDLDMKYNIDFRQNIADSWPKKIDDNILRNQINWQPIYNEFNTAKNIIKSI